MGLRSVNNSFGLCVSKLPKFAFALGAMATAFFATTDNAEARRRHAVYAPPYASMVVDAATGKVLQSTNADAHRFPASVTKVMTLYLLFEQLERGRVRMDTEFTVSSEASNQSPSTLGLSPGEKITVEEAIKALVTKSANDVAVVVAEGLAGDEESFARRMTDKAHSLGMSRTRFRNASGLPDAAQVTTARDLVTLGRAIHTRFPQYYHYFGTRSFQYGETAYRNHNRLLDRVEGVDGIKTGYTRLSGFNLLTSAQLDGRRIFAVVLGGKSGRARDQQVAALVENHIEQAVVGRARPVVAANEEPKAAPRVAMTLEPPARTALTEASARTGSALALKQNAGAAQVRPGTPALALAAPVPPMRWVAGPQGQQVSNKGVVRTRKNADGTYTNSIESGEDNAGDLNQPMPEMKRAEVVETAPVAIAPQAKEVEAITTPAPAAPSVAAEDSAKVKRTGWVIQLAAIDDETKARSLLNRAKSSNPSVLDGAAPFTERVVKGNTTLYRARFAGFETEDAHAACQALKRSGFNCIAQRI